MNLVELGRVTKPHGVRGELRVFLHHADGETLFDVESVVLRTLAGETLRYDVRAARRSGKTVILALDSVNDRDAAEALRGASVGVERGELPPLQEGEYYLCDLMNARVVLGTAEIGIVVEIRVHPTVDCLVVRTPEGELHEQPVADSWIARVDVEAGIVELSSLDGLV